MFDSLPTGQCFYYPFGGCRNSTGDLGKDKLFTGQRLDDTGLYYYGARYYDPTIGRFISADMFVPWSTGVDVVSHPLTVNAIPQGLSSVNAPQGNYPAFTWQAPVNPQNLNRYSYVLNNPLRYNDPYGWWTKGWGFNFSAAMFFIGVSIQFMYIWDGYGNSAIAVTEGGGIQTAIAAASATGQYQTTDAETLHELAGPSEAGGASAGEIIVGGAEKIQSNGWEGKNYFLGLGATAPSPVEVHYLKELTLLAPLTEPVTDELELIEKEPAAWWYDPWYYDDVGWAGDGGSSGGGYDVPGWAAGSEELWI